MFSTSFRRPIGAAADAKELEYVTALHQTVDENEDEFADGSIEGTHRDSWIHEFMTVFILVLTFQTWTKPNICWNITSTAKDVKYYLMSRYGIDVTVEQIQKLVFHDLAGGSNETDCIDICELVAILLIPLLVKSKTADADFSSDRNVMERSIARAFSSKVSSKSKFQSSILPSPGTRKSPSYESTRTNTSFWSTDHRQLILPLNFFERI